ncbi:hypothetical protein IWZ00DRAFT_343801 [Phyllosticta capitalensis]|uniref:Uncharacterized protein n=1 Tax=Phyllosticta capitalensis TaxID=121624 RepID=A0ABR1YA75_9PEZI
MHGHLIYLISDRRAVGRVMMSLRERVSERARQSRRNRSCSCDGQCEYVGSTSRAPQFDGASQFLYSSRVRKKERERERGKLPAGTGTECLPLLLLSFYSACSSQTRAARRPGCEMDDTAARLAMSNRALEQAMQVDQAVRLSTTHTRTVSPAKVHKSQRKCLKAKGTDQEQWQTALPAPLTGTVLLSDFGHAKRDKTNHTRWSQPGAQRQLEIRVRRLARLHGLWTP